ncbi:MAG: CAP domain-containing protein [Bacteroidota bacterium]
MLYRILYVFMAVLLPGISGATGNNWDIAALNTAARAEYLSENEKAVILEINKLRNNPAAYAREYLEPMLTMYKGNMLYMPGNDPIITREGITALKDAIKALKSAKPAPPLMPDQRLTKASADHQQEQSKTGKTGHKGSNGSSIDDRISRYGDWDKKIAENIFYGDPDARSVVLHLVIDDGVPNRGHRINFLDPGLRYVGVACGTHKTYRFLCVMNFAGGFRQ